MDAMKKIYIHSSDDKLKWWGYGEWVEEPDQVYFTHENIECKVVRIAVEEPYTKDFHMFGGYLCGYIKIPNDHFLFGKEYHEIDIDCHGGLTYSDEEGLIGFDCCHSFDVTPSMQPIYEKIKSECAQKFPHMKNSKVFERQYRNIEFCINECKSMANQLNAIKSLKTEDNDETSNL